MEYRKHWIYIAEKWVGKYRKHVVEVQKTGCMENDRNKVLQTGGRVQKTVKKTEKSI